MTPSEQLKYLIIQEIKEIQDLRLLDFMYKLLTES